MAAAVCASADNNGFGCTTATGASAVRESIESKINSKLSKLTEAELQFVKDTLNDSNVSDRELELMNDRLQCDELFFASSKIKATAADDEDDRDDNDGGGNGDELVEGSKRRQEVLEARRNQSKEACRRRARALWKKAGAAAKIVARLSSIRSISGKSKLAELMEADTDSSDSDSDDDDGAKKEEQEEDQQGKAVDLNTTSETVAISDSDEEEDDDDDKIESLAARMPVMPVMPVTPNRRGMFTRQASVSVYEGEGFEIDEELFSPPACSESEEDEDSVDAADYGYGESFPDEKKSDDDDDDDDDDDSVDYGYGDTQDDDYAIETSHQSFSSFSGSRRNEGFRRASVSIDDSVGFEIAEADLFEEVYDDEHNNREIEHFDPWLYTETDEQGKKLDFKILGTSHDDASCHPHVLSPIQMIELQPYLPHSKRGESFWLKYSLVRDGSCMSSFLRNVRGSPCTLVAMETLDGEVFGGFFTESWQIHNGSFGTGESFLWRLKNARKSHDDQTYSSLSEQAKLEHDLESFPSKIYYCNNTFQICTSDKIAAGGGTADYPIDFGSSSSSSNEEEKEAQTTYSPTDMGSGLWFGDGNLLTGTSSACLTYRSPPLSHLHKDGSRFELVNLEVWGFTPCQNEKEAKTLECKNIFFQENSRRSSLQ